LNVWEKRIATPLLLVKNTTRRRRKFYTFVHFEFCKTFVLALGSRRVCDCEYRSQIPSRTGVCYILLYPYTSQAHKNFRRKIDSI